MARESSPLYLRQYEIGPMENFVYFIGDKDTREILIVDPAWQVDTLLKKVREEDLRVRGALITHYHFDHTNGIQELLESVDCPIYVNKMDEPYLDVGSSSIKQTRDGDKLK